MSEGYERRPEERSLSEWAVLAFFILTTGTMLVVIVVSTYQRRQLVNENAALRTQLNFYTVRAPDRPHAAASLG